MPTSITTAPSLTQSPCTSSGPPDGGDQHVGAAADPGEVARARVAGRHGGVAGQQQRRDRLADEVRAADHDGLGALERRRRGGAAAPSRPSGVHGRRPGRPLASRPAEIGVSPSTSLRGPISSVSAPPSTCGGVGSWSRMPGHARVVVELAQQPLDLVVRGVGGQPVVEAARCRPRPTPSACRRRRPPRRGRRRPARSPARAAGARPRPTRRRPRHLGAHLLRDRLAVDDLAAISGRQAIAAPGGSAGGGAERGERHRARAGEDQVRHAVAGDVGEPAAAGVADRLAGRPREVHEREGEPLLDAARLGAVAQHRHRRRVEDADRRRRRPRSATPSTQAESGHGSSAHRPRPPRRPPISSAPAGRGGRTAARRSGSRRASSAAATRNAAAIAAVPAPSSSSRSGAEHGDVPNSRPGSVVSHMPGRHAAVAQRRRAASRSASAAPGAARRHPQRPDEQRRRRRPRRAEHGLRPERVRGGAEHRARTARRRPRPPAPCRSARRGARAARAPISQPSAPAHEAAPPTPWTKRATSSTTMLARTRTRRWHDDQRRGRAARSAARRPRRQPAARQRADERARPGRRRRGCPRRSSRGRTASA